MVPERDWKEIKGHLVDALVWMKGWSLSEQQVEEIVPIIQSLISQLPTDKPYHVCGVEGYNGMLDPPCPACEDNQPGKYVR